PMASAFLRCYSHQTGINYEQVTTGIVLQQLDCSPHHVRKTRLLAAFLDLVCEGELRIAKCAEKLRLAPCRDRLQLGPSANDVKTVAAKFQQTIASVLTLSALFSANKFLRVTAHCAVDL